jgi:hypothetical protein
MTGIRSKLVEVWEDTALHASLPAVLGENPPDGMIGRVEETTASFEARVRASTLPDCGGARGNSRPMHHRPIARGAFEG